LFSKKAFPARLGNPSKTVQKHCRVRSSSNCREVTVEAEGATRAGKVAIRALRLEVVHLCVIEFCTKTKGVLAMYPA